MKKAIGIVSLILAAVVLLTAMFTNGFQERPFVENKEKSLKALNLYAESVEKTKSESDFNIKLTTSVKLSEIDCSNPLFNSILRRIISFRIGREDDEIENFVFENGVLTDDPTITPKNIIQPVNAEISQEFYDGVNVSYLYDIDGTQCVYFIIGKEKASIKDVITNYQNIGEYDIHKSYPQIENLAKKHAGFISIMSVVPRVQKMFDQNNEGNLDEDYKTLLSSNANAGEATKIENGHCFLGDTRVTAMNDSKGRLRDVMINAPAGADVNINFLGNQVKATVSFEISQHYVFEYKN